MRGNTITLPLAYGKTTYCGKLYQYDYGQRLLFTGVDLPETYEVHFANSEVGQSKTAIGTAEAGVIIPDEYLATGSNIHVWIYLHDSATDGETEYHGVIVVSKRAYPSDEEPTPEQQSAITQAIAALDTAVSRAEDAAEDAETAAEMLMHPSATAETLPTGSDATAEYHDGVFAFGLPAGAKGDKGDKGDTGEKGDKGDKGDPGEVSAAQLATALATKADVIISSASGAIASFADGADDLPVRDLTVAIEPVQDLHGYDNPWPAGGGKNKLPSIAKITATQNGITFVCDGDGSCSFSGTATAQASFSYTIPAVTLSENVYVHLFNSNGYADNRPIIDFYYDNERVDFVGFTVANRIYNGTSAMAGNTINKLQLRVSAGFSGTCAFKLYISETADIENFSPYSNICPITGWTGAKVSRTGKNLYEPTVTEYKNESGVSFNGFNITALVTCLNTLPIGTYNVSFKFDVLETVSGATSWGILLRNSVSGYIDGRQNGQHNSGETLSFTRSITITAENKGQFANAYLYSGGGSRAKVYWYDFQLELGSTATAYEPYTGNTLSIDWESEAGTVYGGSLDVTTGVLTVDRAMVVLNGSENWYAYQAFEGFLLSRPDMKYGIRQNGISNMLVNSKTATTGQKNAMWLGVNTQYIYVIGVYETMGSTVEDFKSYLENNNLEIEIPLATSQTYQLTPQEVKTLLGNNNIYSDTGDSSVTYPADTKLYIDGKIAAALGG